MRISLYAAIFCFMLCGFIIGGFVFYKVSAMGIVALVINFFMGMINLHSYQDDLSNRPR